MARSPSVLAVLCAATLAASQHGSATINVASRIESKGSLQFDFLGAYDKRPGHLTNGRSSYTRRGDRTRAMWYTSKGNWIVGFANDIGSGRGTMRVFDQAMAPERITNEFQVWDGGNKVWIEAPEIHVEVGDGEKEHLKAVQAADGSREIVLWSSTDSALHRDLQGAYDVRDDYLINRRPAYSKRGDASKAMW